MSPPADPRARLAALREHPDFPAAMHHRPTSIRIPLLLGCQGALALGFVGLVAFLALSGSVPAGLGGFAQLVILFIGALGALLAVWSIVRLVRFVLSRLERLPALVVGKRQHVSRGMGTSEMTSTTYHVTLELEGAGRREVETGGRLYGRLGPGDVGVAYLRAGHLLDYRRLDTSAG